MKWIALAILLYPVVDSVWTLVWDAVVRRWVYPTPPGWAAVAPLTPEQQAKQTADAEEMQSLMKKAMRKLAGGDEPWEGGGP